MNQKYLYAIIGILVAGIATFAIIKYVTPSNGGQILPEPDYIPYNQNNGSQTPPPTQNDDHGSPAVFTQELKYGMKDNDQIAKLQVFLIARGY